MERKGVIHLSAQSVKECVGCGVEKPRTHQYFEGNRSKCRGCRNEELRIRNAQKKKENPVKYFCKQMAFSAYSRVFAPSREYKKGYRRIEGEAYGFINAKEMAEYLYQNFYEDIKSLLDEGKSPSVDRLNSKLGYTKHNIRILDHKSNTLLGVESVKRKIKVTFPDGKSRVFESAEKVAEYFGTNSSHVRCWIKGTFKPQNKCKFEFYDQTNESEAV